MSNRTKSFGEKLTDRDFPGNIYAYLAYFAAGPLKRPTDPLTDATAAQAFATMALTFEQRTANLIEISKKSNPDVQESTNELIVARLGLRLGERPTAIPERNSAHA